MNDNGHGTLPLGIGVAETRPVNVIAQLSITAFTDRPPSLSCTGGMEDALKLLSLGVGLVAAMVSRMESKTDQAPVENKKREYLGPREG